MTRTVVITGVTSGFGKGVALKLAEGDFNLVLAARRGEALEQTAAECGERAVAVTADVGEREDVERLAETAISTFGGFDVWINNAGVGVLGRFDEVPLEDHQRVIKTNLLGAIHGSYAALRHFRSRGQGNLINIASTASKVAHPYFASYCASKFGVLGLSSSIRQELEVNDETGIKICVVHPWAVDTPFFEHAGNYTGHSLRMPMMQDPEGTVEAIVGLVDKPQDDLDVSVLVKGSVLSSHLAPGLTEAMTAKVIHKTLIEDAPAVAAPTSGSLHEPLPIGTTVEGGNRERIEQEDAAKAG